MAVQLLILLAGTLAAAASVPLIWWLGVWGLLKTQQRRLDDAELEIEALRSRFRREDGRVGAREQQRRKTREEELEDKRLAELEEAVLKAKGAPPMRALARVGQPTQGKEPDVLAPYTEPPKGRAS